MLLVLLLGVADFGRVFQAGITIEAAARNGAEAAAQEYRQLARGATLPLATVITSDSTTSPWIGLRRGASAPERLGRAGTVQHAGRRDLYP